MTHSHTPQRSGLRAPATPLVTHDPYFSVWQMADTLTEDWSRHWTGAVNAMCGIARIDGQPYRFLGWEPQTAEPMTQVSLEVLPTRTIAVLEAANVRLTLTFLTPFLPDDIDLLSRPLTYVVFDVQSLDDQPHHVQLYFDVSAEWAVNSPEQKVEWSRHSVDGVQVLRIGSADQPVLEKSGDNLRIDWGYLHLAFPADLSHEGATCSDTHARSSFAHTGVLIDAADLRMPRKAGDEWPVLATTFDLSLVDEPVRRYVMLAYDDEFSIEYFHRKLRPYWRRNGLDAFGLIREAAASFEDLAAKSEALDARLMDEFRSAGGDKYADLAALSYRQCLAAHKIVEGPSGDPLMFSKENFSNGCMGTVDVTYPSAPFFLHLNVELLKAQVTPVLDYAQSPRWKHRFAPHDLGTYPLANGQVYGGGEDTEKDQMPVEECGNMILLVAAIARKEGSADYALKYWRLLEGWAKYLLERGLDPENQLCTDDFAGHMAHNANLSLKAICAIGAFGMLAEMAGKKRAATEYRAKARKMAKQWQLIADDLDHYRLAFDKKGSWSQKYNMVWDRLFGMGLFPDSVAQKEVAHYIRKSNRYGLPLDSRNTYTKFDWIVWSAALSSSAEDRERLIAPMWDFVNTSSSRVPLTDWYDTVSGKQVEFQARSVVGGIYILLLDGVRIEMAAEPAVRAALL